MGITRLLEGNRSQFETMVRAHSGDLYRFAYWLCRDRFVAEDLVQETYSRAWKSWQSLRDEKAIKHWLFSILRNEHARLYERKRVEIEDVDLEDLPIAVESSVQFSLEMREALQSLPEGYREPLLLQVVGGFSCAEIGQMLELSEQVIMKRVSRARNAMRKLMEPEKRSMERVR
ncbi:MAG: sigma-70 family RNA polymerase sigma factor [Betaproteobacteria bacterium]|nr:sigma-70 family RNA polymerase sigma factor [Betaproteobacteria bacterium]